MRMVHCLSLEEFKDYVNIVLQRYEELEEQEAQGEAELNEDHEPVLLQSEMIKTIENRR
jgi:small nuclear ribonucleoprotein (snRNP)-like protein